MTAGPRRKAPPQRPPPERAKTPADLRAESLFREHYAGVFAYALNHTGSVEAARETAAAVFASALKERAAGHTTRLRLIALARSQLPAKAQPPRAGGESEGPLQRALGSLSPEQRDLLSLRFDAGLTYDEIAQLLDRTPRQVSSDVLRSVMRLRRHMAMGHRRR